KSAPPVERSLWPRKRRMRWHLSCPVCRRATPLTRRTLAPEQPRAQFHRAIVGTRRASRQWRVAACDRFGQRAGELIVQDAAAFRSPGVARAAFGASAGGDKRGIVPQADDSWEQFSSLRQTSKC